MSTTDLKKLKKGEDFCWGEIITIHKIGPYSIVEYIHNPLPPNKQEILFHPYFEEQDTCHSFDSIEEAIIYAIIFNKCGRGNSPQL